MKKLMIFGVMISLSACSAAPIQGLCYKNKMYYPNDSKICGDIKIVDTKNGGVNVEGDSVPIHN